MSLLEYAKVEIKDHNLFNREFDDIYFQPDLGFAESDHTFIHANDLPNRFSRLTENESITIAEIGFGSGLNFINTVQHFFNNVHKQAQETKNESNSLPKLIYCSVDKHPICLPQLKQIQQQWPLSNIRKALYEQYPHNHAGFHYITLHPQVRLLLLMGEAIDMISTLQAKVDAWFLDGFAPAKNPDCWSQSLFGEIARCSHSQTTLSSFSAARLVRENLQLSGFSHRKCRGYGQKRDMITATFTNTFKQAEHWSSLAQPLKTKQIAIIGAGIAGSTTANTLATQNFKVKVFHEPDMHPCASAVPLAVPYLQPGLNDNLFRDFQLNAWHHALRHFQHLNKLNPNILFPCPIIRQPLTHKDSERHHKLFDQALLNDKQWALHGDNIHYLQAGILQPNELIKTLLSHNNITVKQQSITEITREKNQWRIGNELFDIVILATGWQTTLYPDDAIAKTLRPIRGQGTFLTVEHKPNAIYCDKHATIPHPTQNIVYVGSTFGPNNCNFEYSKTDDIENKAAYLAKFMPLDKREEQTSIHIIDSFIGIRCAAHDYQPLLGPIPIEADVIAKYHPWRKDSGLKIEESLNHYPGLYINAGYGSKGMTNAFLNADILTAMITEQPLPVNKNLLPYILPARIIIRQLIRRQL